MGLLYEKYASPNDLINRMLKVGKFHQFAMDLVNKKNEEAEKEKLWQLYLHHPFLEVSFDAWKKECVVENKPIQQPTTADLTATVTNTFDILEGFSPDQ